MSMLSGSGEHLESPRTRELNLRRASVLSFQTALSGMGGYASNEDTSGPVDLEQLDGALPRRPWLQNPESGGRSGVSSYSSSPDERLPGGWRSLSWLHEGEASRTPHLGPGNGGVGRRTPSQSPRMHLSPLVDDSDRLLSNTPIKSRQSSNPSESPNKQMVLAASATQSASNTLTTEPFSEPSHKNALLSPLSDQARVQSPASGTSTIDAPSATADVSADVGDETLAPRRQSTIATIKPEMVRTSEQSRAEKSPKTSLDGSMVDSPKESEAPVLPEKSSPPVPSKEREVGLSSPPLSDDVISTALPVDTSSKSPAISRIPESVSPVNDIRLQPLSKMADAGQTDMLETVPQPIEKEYKNAAESKERVTDTASIRPGVGAHNTRIKSGGDAGPAFAALMRDAGSSAVARPVTTGAPVPEPRSDSPSIETPPREPSPPPEGEVEARAEWERTQMRRIAEQSKNKANSSRKATFRTQLKPLQLVAAEEAKQQARMSTTPRISPDQSTVKTPPKDEQRGIRSTAGPSTVPDGAVPANSLKAGPVLSTQQLQRMSARDMRLSASAINMASGVTEIGGAYPVFASPPISAVKPGERQYPGLMPQRSLVPPFELQNRPDGLPSGLIGPDGIRKSPNDPDVCLECMMRDEDMIDVHVVGAGLWERESDKDFSEACRLEADDDARREQQGPRTQGEASVNSHGGTIESSSIANAEASSGRPRFTKVRVKRVAKGEPLTAERLKLHTQMNPPASSHRWRTLQTFLAVQAKYIAMDQRARGMHPPAVPIKQSEYDNSMIRTTSNDSKRTTPSQLVKIDESAPLTAQERLQKEKGAALVREARRRNGTSAPDVRGLTSQAGARPSPTGLSVCDLDSPVIEDEQKRLSIQFLGNENSSGNHSIPRRNNGPGPAYVRAGSAQDLRSIPYAMHKAHIDMPPSPSSALAPPSAPFRSSTPQAFGSRGMRTASSQLSLANSGSMIDMHVGNEDRRDHRLSQAGFLPGTPLHTTSPGAFNRAYYGFPGDGDSARNDEGPDGRVGDSSMQSNELDTSYGASRDAEKKRKKGTGGLRGLFNKISGKDSLATDAGAPRRDTDDGEGPRLRKISLGAEASLADLQPPPTVGGLMNRARRSTSSLLNISNRPSMDGSAMLNDRLGLPMLNSPGMNSQISLDMGPFGSGPLPPPRKESRGPQADPSTGDYDRRSRTLSAGNMFGKRKAPNVTDLPVSSTGIEDSAQSSSGPRISLQHGEPRHAPEAERTGSPLSRDTARMGGQAAYRKSHLSDLMPRSSCVDGVQAPGRPSPAPSSVLQFDGHRQSVQSPAQAQPPWAGQHAVPPPSYRQNEMRPHTPSSTNAMSNSNPSSGTGPPKRPPRNPSRGAASQPASEHANDNAADAAPMSQLLSPLPHRQTTFEGPTPDGMYSPRQSAYAPGLQAFPVYEDSAYPMHTRSGSASGGLTAFDSDPQTMEGFDSMRSRALSASTPPAQTRKSRLLRLPFGKNKRESVATSISSNKFNSSTGTGTGGTPSLKSRSSRGTLDELNMSGLGAMGNQSMQTAAYGRTPSMVGPNANGYQFSTPASQETPFRMNVDRREVSGSYEQDSFPSSSPAPSPSGLKPWLQARRGSNSFDDRNGVIAGLPPRSQSALGMLDSGQFDDTDPIETRPTKQPNNSSGKRSFLPRLRTSSRAALRSVDED